MAKKAKSSSSDNSESVSDKAAKPTPTVVKLPHLFNLAALVLAAAALIGLLTYDLWGAHWLNAIGRGQASIQPHNHSAIEALREDKATQATQILEMASRLQNIRSAVDELKAQQKALSEREQSRLEALENLQQSLAQQNTAFAEQVAALENLQADVNRLQQEFAQNPDTLASLIGLIRERRNVGLPLENIPALLRAFASDDAALQNIADTLQAFAEIPVPPDSDLVRDYRILRPQIAIAFGGTPSLSGSRDFWENVKNYIRSLVTVRKLEEQRQAEQAEVPLDNLGEAIAERNFAAVYDLAFGLRGTTQEIDAWLDKLQLRNRADAAIIALQNHLHSDIAKRLENNGEAE